MSKQCVTITNPAGIHARPATQLVEFCQRYQSEITLECEGNGVQVNPKSIFSLLAGRIKPGTTVSVVATGVDAERAVAEICDFICTLEE